MSTLTTRSTPPVTMGSAGRRVAALARAEWLLLRRSPSALLGALIAPASLAVVPLSNPDASGQQGSTGAVVVVGLTVFTLLLAVYYNLVTALVSRREELVLKRLRTGEVRDTEIIAGTAAPAVALAWAQVFLGMGIAVAFLDLGTPSNIALVVVALLLGTLLCLLLAAVVSTWTGSVEMAQLTATPLLLVSMLFSGALIPLDALPGPMRALAQVLPLSSVAQLMELGLTGSTSDGATVHGGALMGEAVTPLLVLTGWLLVSAWAVRRWFRWEPRR
jgi:ABC-2 type transport system permease protein